MAFDGFSMVSEIKPIDGISNWLNELPFPRLADAMTKASCDQTSSLLVHDISNIQQYCEKVEEHCQRQAGGFSRLILRKILVTQVLVQIAVNITHTQWCSCLQGALDLKYLATRFAKGQEAASSFMSKKHHYVGLETSFLESQASLLALQAATSHSGPSSLHLVTNFAGDWEWPESWANFFLLFSILLLMAGPFFCPSTHFYNAEAHNPDPRCFLVAIPSFSQNVLNCQYIVSNFHWPVRPIGLGRGVRGDEIGVPWKLRRHWVGVASNRACIHPPNDSREESEDFGRPAHAVPRILFG